MAIYNITSLSSTNPQRQGAVIRSVATEKTYRAHYGVQSATFTRTVFPGQASGTYRLNGKIPTWQGPQYTSKSMLQNTSNVVYFSGRSAGSPPIPYPPSNASAYYSNPKNRIVPNYYCSTCR